MSENHNKPPELSNQVIVPEGNESALDQMSVLVQAFFESPGTMLMKSRDTGIERASICRRVSDMKKNQTIDIVKFDYCKISHARAAYYTTDLSKYFGTSQLSLF